LKLLSGNNENRPNLRIYSFIHSFWTIL